MADKMIYPLRIQDISSAPSQIIMHSTMAAKPEEFLGLAEPAPLPPSVLLDLPVTTQGDSQQPQNDLALAYISRMLTEDIVDMFFYQYPNHPKLLEVEQPFAEILLASANTSSDAQEPLAPGMLASTSILMPRPSQGNITDIMVSRCEVQDPAFLLNGTGIAEPNSMVYPSESSISMDMQSSMAMFKGMEEANRNLPTDNAMVDGRGRKKRSDIDGETEAGLGRSSKQIVVLLHTDSEQEEEATALEMFDRLILNGYDTYPSERHEVVRVTWEDKAMPTRQRTGRCRMRQTVVTDLETLLIRCVEAVASDDMHGASKLLERVKWHSSPTGEYTRQQLAHYFAQALEARLVGTGSRLYRSLMGKRTSVVELIKACHLYMTACCFMKVALLFSSKTIYNAVAGRRKLHIVHYGINIGFQWPELLRLLADREGGPPEVRITGINRPQPGLRSAERMEEAGHRLSSYASQFGVPFKFHAIASKPEDVQAEDLHIDPNEVLIVNSLFDFRTLMDESLTFDRVNPRDMVLNNIRKMRPSVFIHSVVNGQYSAGFFMTRFRQAFYFFTALFDVMETTVPWDNDKRLLVEQNLFARSTVNMIACEGADRVERPQNYKEWLARNQRAGLRQLPLDPDIVLMLKDQVKNQYHKHFMISEDHRWLLQGWKGQVLYAHSTWAADDASGSQVP